MSVDGRGGGDECTGGTDQVVEGGALLVAAHVFEKAMVGYQQQRTRVLLVVVHVTLHSERQL